MNFTIFGIVVIIQLILLQTAQKALQREDIEFVNILNRSVFDIASDEVEKLCVENSIFLVGDT